MLSDCERLPESVHGYADFWFIPLVECVCQYSLVKGLDCVRSPRVNIGVKREFFA